jgi:prevent-host-death family protein
MDKVIRSRSVEAQTLCNDLSAILHGLRDEPEVVITEDGKPTAVIVDIERYAELRQALQEFADPAYLAALLEARREIRSGEGVPAEEVFARKGL